ncbi:5-formyltetrahydrofolate cyclo-ligase [Spirosoma flavum]|uniref:5-formyltetrahydrofolate cyclo-ligase n=1 Tax=Spirosoma flavum TaxID=2048557 RepID=A0ABW6ARW8_9BACT
MNKVDLRREYLTKRKALTAREVEHRSQLIGKLFFDFLVKTKLVTEPVMLHTFLPIQRTNEVDTWLIIRHLWAAFKHIQIAVPVTDTAQSTLGHYLISPETPLVENRWGIPEPPTQGYQPLSPIDFRIVLVPLLVFDQQGHRVGYGGGYYDRFLSHSRPDCLKVGLSLFEPVEAIDDAEPTDIPLTICITPVQDYTFN